MEPIGTIVSLSGSAQAQTGGQPRALQEGSPVYANDVLSTGEGSSIEIRFVDETVLSQGPSAQMALDEYIYDPATPSASSLLANLSKGTFRLVTGKISKDNPDGLEIKTPLATIGVRGTGADFELAPEGEKYGIFQYDQLDLVVSTGQGTRFITQAGIIVDAAPDGALGPPRPYYAQEITRFQTLAPIVSVPGLQQLSPDDAPDEPPPGEEPPVEGEEPPEEAEEELGEEGGDGEEAPEGEGGEEEEPAEPQGDELEEPEEEVDELDAEAAVAEADELSGEPAAAGDIPVEPVAEQDEPENEALPEVDELAGDAPAPPPQGPPAPTPTLVTSDPFSREDPFQTTPDFGNAVGTEGDDTTGETGSEGDDTTSGTEILVGTVQELLGDIIIDDDDDNGDDQDDDDFDISVYTLYIGTDGDDGDITGTSARDLIIGRNGSEVLRGMGGADFLIGDYPPSSATAPDGTPLFTNITGSAGNDTMYGGEGDDEFLSGEGNDHFIGNDTGIDDDAKDTIIYERSGTWTSPLYPSPQGHNGIEVQLADGSGTGTAKDEWGNSDTIIGIDHIDASINDDIVIGNNDANKFWGNKGNDTLVGQDGNDTLMGDTGADSLTGGIGDDSLDGGSDNDTLSGGENNDSLLGGGGLDSLSGGLGNDTLDGGNENDTVKGDAGQDLMYGGTGNDSMLGGDDNDTLYGQADNDLLDGELGNDKLYGGDGADILDGGSGIDTMDAGNDNYADTFYWNDKTHGNANAQVRNFDAGEDKLLFDAGGFSGTSAGALSSSDVTIGNFGGSYGGTDGNSGARFIIDTYDAANGNYTLIFDLDGTSASNEYVLCIINGEQPTYEDMEIVNNRPSI